MAFKDRRRQDRRSAVHTQTPFWIKSAQLCIAEGNADTVFFSFPTGSLPAAGTYAIHAVATKIEEVFDGDASFVLGQGTIPLDTSAETANVTVVDADYFIVSADVTETALGVYAQAGGQFATDLGVGKIALINTADATVPVVYGKLTHTTSTKGKLRVLLLVSRVD